MYKNFFLGKSITIQRLEPFVMEYPGMQGPVTMMLSGKETQASLAQNAHTSRP